MFRNGSIGAPWAGALPGGMLPPPACAGCGPASQVSASIDGVCNVPATPYASSTRKGRGHGDGLPAALLWHQHHRTLANHMTYQDFYDAVAGSRAPARYVLGNGRLTGFGHKHLDVPSEALQAEADALRAAHPEVFQRNRLPPPPAIVAAVAWRDDAGLRSRRSRMGYARDVGLDPRDLDHYVSPHGKTSKQLRAVIDRWQALDPFELRNAVQALRKQYPRVFSPSLENDATGAAPSSAGVQSARRRRSNGEAQAAALAWHQDYPILSCRMSFQEYCRQVSSESAPGKYVKADGTPINKGVQLLRNVSSKLQAAADDLRAKHPRVFAPHALALASPAAPPPPLWPPSASSPWRPWSDGSAP